jgi:hypothetical protein
MALRTFSFCTYFTDFGNLSGKAAKGTYHACKFIKAIKGEGVSKYAYVPVPIYNGQQRYLENANRDDVFGWFGEMVAGLVGSRTEKARPLSFIPIPSSECTSEADVRNCRTFRLVA